MARWEPDAEGRLRTAALTLFDEQGYDETTVADIARAAGLTKRTFFRYFADKREVLFNGSYELEQQWILGIRTAPPDAGPMAALSAGLDQVGQLLADSHSFATVRARVVAASSELRERELIKLQSLAEAVATALVGRGLAVNSATLAAQAGVTVFHVAFNRWVQQDSPDSLRQLMVDSLAELRTVTAQ